jgi:arylsulfatase A-like enzyme
MIFSDERSPGFLSCYGVEIATPGFDTLGGTGACFSNVYSAVSTRTPSRSSLLTDRRLPIAYSG